MKHILFYMFPILLIKIYVLTKILKGGCRILEYVYANWQRCCSVRPEAPVYLYPYLSKDVNSLVCVIIPTPYMAQSG